MNANDPQKGELESSHPDFTKKPEPTQQAERAEAALHLRHILDANPVTNVMSPAEEAIGIDLRLLLQTAEEIEHQHAVIQPHSRQAMLEDLLKYMSVKRFTKLREAILQLSKELPHVHVKGMQLAQQEIYDVLYKLAVDAKTLMKIKDDV